MGLKKKLFKKHFGEIEALISHSPFVYTKIIFFTALIGIGLIMLWLYVRQNWGLFYIKPDIIKFVILAIAVLAYLNFLIKFFDLYLDTIVLTPEGLYIHRRGWLLQNSQSMISRDWLESVSYTQNGLIENLFKFGDISLIHINGEEKFNNVPNPRENSQKILLTKRKYTSSIPWEESQQKMEILIEALGEVVKEYLDSNQKPDPESEI